MKKSERHIPESEGSTGDSEGGSADVLILVSSTGKNRKKAKEKASGGGGGGGEYPFLRQLGVTFHNKTF
jgi:hypothetical protein